MKFKIAMMALIVSMSGCNDAPKPENIVFPKDINVIDKFNTGEVTMQRFYDRTFNNVCYIRISNNSMSCVHIPMPSETKQ